MSGTHRHHGHGRGHDARLAGDRRALTLALVLISAFIVIELVAGVVAGSLALLADAAHMVTDGAALALALFAASVAGRPARGRWTFGFRRVEILAAQINGITLLVVGVWIVYVAIRRLIEPTEVQGGIVLVVALVGIAVNLAAAAILRRPGAQSLNVRGALLHLATDVAAFAGTAVAGALILLTGWDRFDPLASLAVAGLVFWSSAVILRESGRIFLEVSPAELDPDAVGRAIVEQEDVVEVHDLHVWTVTSGFPALSAHVLVEDGAECHAVRRSLERMLIERFSVDHTTLQVDHAESEGSRRVELGQPYRRREPLGR